MQKKHKKPDTTVAAEEGFKVVGMVRAACEDIVKAGGIEIEVAGSLRRGLERVHDVDIVIVFKDKKLRLEDVVRRVLAMYDNNQRIEKSMAAYMAIDTIPSISISSISSIPSILSKTKAKTEMQTEIQQPTKHRQRDAVWLGGVLVDLYATTPEERGAMMLFATGSKEFNIQMRSAAKKKGLKLNQYGLFCQKTGRKVCSARTEKDIFGWLGMEFVPPNKR